MAKIKAGNYVLFDDEIWQVVCRHRTKTLHIKKLDWFGIQIFIPPKKAIRITEEVANVIKGV